MAAKFIRLMAGLGLMLSIFFPAPMIGQARPQAAAAVVMLSPAACPASGCAAGQKLDFKVDFDLAAYAPTLSPNVQVCVYTPIIWSANLFRVSPTGDLTGANYAPGFSYCTNDVTPEGYNLLGGATASLPANQFGDALVFSFRIGGGALNTGSVLVRVLEQAPVSGWSRTSQAFSSVRVVPTDANVFVANDAAACSTNSPCYINSLEDLVNGVGTGLKDAVDARLTPTTITILGNYNIKDQTVTIQHPHVLQGGYGASLSYNGTLCTQPMLKITGGASLKNLAIRDGNCTTTSRDLVVVEGSTPVLIEYSTLTGGKDAIQASGLNSGNLQVRFNQITANSGYAIWLASANTGTLEAVGNNLYTNRVGAQVECNLHGRVEHNFWGAGVAATTASSNCTVTETKRLGAPVLLNPNGAGVVGTRVTVSETKSYYADAVGYQRAGGTNFDLYLINHGAGSNVNIPFTSTSPANINPCSSYWDFFLAENVTLDPAVVLSLFLKYDRTSGCVATISSTRYCAQPDPADMTLYPLYWYDPANYPTLMEWKTTGTTGQATTCLVADDEIRVDIDNSGRPNLADMQFLPFVIGLPGQPTAVEVVNYGAEPTHPGIGWLLLVSLLGMYAGLKFWLQRGGRHGL